MCRKLTSAYLLNTGKDGQFGTTLLCSMGLLWGGGKEKANTRISNLKHSKIILALEKTAIKEKC